MTTTAEATRTLLRESERVREILTTLARYGLASRVAEGLPAPVSSAARRAAEPELLAMSEGERVRGVCLDLGTTFIKLGQILSTRRDLVGPEIAEALSSLQGDVPSDPPGEVVALIEAELGAPPSELFAEFDEEPLGSASIAQVHAARLHGGEDVVVKVQHPGTRERVERDMDILEALAVIGEAHDSELSLYRVVETVGQLRRSLLAEVDFRVEAGSLARVRENFAEEPDVVIPQPFPERSSERVLTMSRLEGDNLAKVIGDLGERADAFVRRGADIYVEMIFRDGFFHADPHPGNLVVVEGDRVGLLDFGKVGRVDEELGEVIDDVVLGVLGEDPDTVVDAVVRICDPPLTLDRAALRKDMAAWIERHTTAGAAQIDMAAAREQAEEILRRHRLQAPPDAALLVRTLTQLQGLLVETGADVQIWDVLRPHAQMIAQRRFDPRRALRRATRRAREWERLIDALPGELTRTLDGLRSGEVEVPLRLERLDRNVNRLVYALVASSLFIGSSRMWASRVPPTARGISVPGAIGTVASTALAARLLRAAHRSGGLD